MGKARILSAQGEGLYSIEILEDRARAESLKQRALQRIDEIDSELTTLEAELEQARQEVDDAAEAQDQAIEQHQAEILATGESRVDLQAPAQAVLEAAAARAAIRTRIGSLNLERLQQQDWIDRVDALPPLRTQQAWCADYTEDLSGEVATAEVPGEAKQVIIKPGYEGANQWSASEDGAMQPALAGTPAGVFYNLAMMPGWQKWRPTFRVATISNINEDLCDIILDAATSSQQGLNVNAQGSYSGVPIYYMDCNGAAFEDGDRVLVAFSGNTELPMVVGFESSPKVCGVFEGDLVIWMQFSNSDIVEFMQELNAWFAEVASPPENKLRLVLAVSNTATVYEFFYDSTLYTEFDDGILPVPQYDHPGIQNSLYITWLGPFVSPVPADFITRHLNSSPYDKSQRCYIAIKNQYRGDIDVNTDGWYNYYGINSSFDTVNAITFVPSTGVGSGEWIWAPEVNLIRTPGHNMKEIAQHAIDIIKNSSIYRS